MAARTSTKKPKQVRLIKSVAVIAMLLTLDSLDLRQYVRLSL